jgi:hypothetical protein
MELHTCGDFTLKYRVIAKFKVAIPASELLSRSLRKKVLRSVRHQQEYVRGAEISKNGDLVIELQPRAENLPFEKVLRKVLNRVARSIARSKNASVQEKPSSYTNSRTQSLARPVVAPRL